MRPRHHAGRIHQTPSDTLLQKVAATSSSVWLPSSSTNPCKPHHQNERVIISPAVLFQNSVGGSLRGFEGGKIFGKFASNPIRSKNQSIPLRNRKHGGLKGRQLGTNHTGTQEQHLLHGSLRGARAQQYSLNIADADPGQHAMSRVNGSKADYDAAR